MRAREKVIWLEGFPLTAIGQLQSYYWNTEGAYFRLKTAGAAAENKNRTLSKLDIVMDILVDDKRWSTEEGDAEDLEW